MSVTDRIARTVRAAGALADARLQPSHEFMRGVMFTSFYGEAGVYPVSRMGESLLRVQCTPKVGESWGVEFTTFAPGAEAALLKALEQILWTGLRKNSELEEKSGS